MYKRENLLSKLEQQVLHMSCNWHTVLFFYQFPFFASQSTWPTRCITRCGQVVDGLLQDVQDAHG